MKKMLPLLLGLLLLTGVLGAAQAAPDIYFGYAPVTYEGATYDLCITDCSFGGEKATVTAEVISGNFRIHIRNDQAFSPIDMDLEVGGKRLTYANVNVSGNTLTFSFDTRETPEAVILYPVFGDNEPEGTARLPAQTADAAALYAALDDIVAAGKLPESGANSAGNGAEAAPGESPIAITERSLVRESGGLMLVPYEEDIAYLINNTMDTSMQMQSDPENIFVYAATYDVAQPGGPYLVKVTLTSPDGSEISREKETDLGSGSGQSLTVAMKNTTSEPGTYTFRLFIDGVQVESVELTMQ